MTSSYKKQISSKLKAVFTHGSQDTDIYVAGSLRVSRESSFNASLSDIDLLIIPNGDSLDTYVKHYQQLISIPPKLTLPHDQLVEFFVLSSSIIEMYTHCLSTLINANRLYDEDRIFTASNKNSPPYERVAPSLVTRQNLYKMAANKFCAEIVMRMPLADTSKARKTAKNLLAGLKLIICAKVDETRLNEMEKQLFAIYTFEQIRPILTDVLPEVSIIIDPIFQQALDGKACDDWSEWMVAQDVIAKQLLELTFDMTNREKRFYDGMYQMRDMLVISVKNILNEADRMRRNELMDVFVHDAAGVIARLALMGVERLVDFDDIQTPQMVTESSEVLIEYLKGEPVNLRHMAASVILLEYGFKQSIVYADNNLN